jgi:DNA-binding CsgD family transcriptional regulator
MDMNSPGEILNQIYSIQRPEVDNSDYAEFEKKIGFLEKLTEVENSSVNVLDLNLKKYIFLGSKYLDRFENPSIEHKTNDPFYYTQFIHPDDQPLVFDSYRRTFNFILTQPVEKRKDFKLILNFRQLDRNGRYLNLILQVVVLELDKKGNIWLVLIIDDLLPGKIIMNEVNRKLENIKTGKTCLFINESIKKNKTILSTREIEVLDLVSKGFVSKEIADKLYVSVNTVNNHRQNILEKINATNTSEAVIYARNLGLL